MPTNTAPLDQSDDPYVGTDVVHKRFGVSTSARQRWEKHPDPQLRFPRGVKFTPGGRLLWKSSWLDALEARVHAHARAQQFDHDELPGLEDWLPSTRETLEAEIVQLRGQLDTERAGHERTRVQLTAVRAENEALRAENAAVHGSNRELCKELNPPIDLEAVEAE